ncbi:MAG: DNA polymerase/3'-5' exonuclease PolX [Candidatus Omnitrophica bacterium]|nr:DNA polymerase/3'-5' exonuclease PolX [Candidatus Omnitrophota bacterium]
MQNKQIAEIFRHMGTLLEIQGENVFKIRAYFNAAENIETLVEDIAVFRDENRLHEIPGIGKAFQEKIIEYLDTGKMSAYQKLIQQVPESILGVIGVPSVGPKKAKLFYDQLKIKSVDDLQQAAESGKLFGLPGIKEKTVEKILQGIHVVTAGQQYMTLAQASGVAQELIAALKKQVKVKKIEVAGSLRRQKEQVRDIDVLVVATDPAAVMDAFVHLPQVKQINARGETKSSILTNDNVQVDLRVVDLRNWGAALLYFTGSKNFNVKLRQLAIKKEMKVNEYGIFEIKGKKEKFVAGKTEKECLKVFGLPYIEPELREDAGEAVLFGANAPKIPQLIEEKDIRGDLHVHSVWSDGHNTIEEIVRAAQKRGYEYIAISDHSPSLGVAKGLSIENLMKKKEEIVQLNKRLKNFKVLLGTEVEIDKDGNLDYNDKILAEFDVVIAAVHSGFNQPRGQLTKRLVKACQNKYVTAIAHPFGTHFGKREPYDIDFKEVCKAAVNSNTFLEINAFPIRMDLNSVNTYYARRQGVKFLINTDAHRIEHLDFMKYGVAIARRAWLTKEDVVNTSPVRQLLKKGKRFLSVV